MKRAPVMAGVFLGLLLLRLPSWGQDSTNLDASPTVTNSPAASAAAIAEQQAADEKYKRLAADIESLRAANQAILDKLTALKEDLQQIRSDQARLAASAVNRDDLKPLAQRIEEVDKKREDDKQLISEQIKKTVEHLEKLLTASATPTPMPIPPAKPPHSNDTPATEDGFSYKIKDGDRLSDIVAAYNEEFKNKGMKSISLKQAMDANPDVDWKHLKIGQRIVIPHPPE